MLEVKKDFQWNGPEIPNQKPPILDLATGLDGRIWVQLSAESEAYEPEVPNDARGPVPPTVKFRPKEKLWDVFEPDGRYAGRLRAPREYSLFARRGNHAWGVARDENDIPVVVRFGVKLLRGVD
jgi:hypothetical protein